MRGVDWPLAETRQMREDEFDMCVTLLRASFGTVAAEFGLTRENCPTNGAFIEKNSLVADASNGCTLYGLFDQGQLAGVVQLTQVRDGVCEIKKLAVIPERRHEGFGRRLIAYALQTATRHGASRVTLGIIEENVRLKTWYMTCGFAHTGTRKFAHLPFTVGFMEMALDTGDHDDGRKARTHP